MKTTKFFQSPASLILFALLLAAASALTSCGYSNPYVQSEKEEEVTQNAVSIYVDMWENKTSEFGLQSEIKQSLTRWLKKSPHFSIANNPNHADYILDGVIKSMQIPGLSYGKWDRAVELRAKITFEVELKKRETGEIILKKTNTDWHESFDTGNDAASMEMNKREALREIADNIAENIYVNLFNKFSSKNNGKTNIPFDKTNVHE